MINDQTTEALCHTNPAINDCAYYTREGDELYLELQVGSTVFVGILRPKEHGAEASE